MANIKEGSGYSVPSREGEEFVSVPPRDRRSAADAQKSSRLPESTRQCAGMGAGELGRLRAGWAFVEGFLPFSPIGMFETL
jgi:hypothetical protein